MATCARRRCDHRGRPRSDRPCPSAAELAAAIDAGNAGRPPDLARSYVDAAERLRSTPDPHGQRERSAITVWPCSWRPTAPGRRRRPAWSTAMPRRRYGTSGGASRSSPITFGPSTSDFAGQDSIPPCSPGALNPGRVTIASCDARLAASSYPNRRRYAQNATHVFGPMRLPSKEPRDWKPSRTAARTTTSRAPGRVSERRRRPASPLRGSEALAASAFELELDAPSTRVASRRPRSAPRSTPTLRQAMPLSGKRAAERDRQRIIETPRPRLGGLCARRDDGRQHPLLPSTVTSPLS